MKPGQRRVPTTLLGVFMLCVVLSVSVEAQRPGQLSPQDAVGPSLSWVGSSARPGFYAARDYRNLNPSTYNLTGGHQTFYWADIEPTEGSFRWEAIDVFIASQQHLGKPVALGITTFNGRQNWGNAANPPIRVPDYVFAAGAGKVVCPDGFEIPKFWDPVYLAKYRGFVTALAARYDGEPDIEFIQIGVGRFGETQPCDDSDDTYVQNALIADGFSPTDKWAETVNAIIDIYADSFHNRRLLLPNGPRFVHECERRTFNSHAVNRGVGLFPAEIYAIPQWVDLRTKDNFEYCGKLDYILDWAQTDNSWSPPTWAGITNTQVPATAFEGYGYTLPNSTEFYWGIVGALSRHPDYITLERTALYIGGPRDWSVTPLTDSIAVIGWAKPYMGKHVSDTPSVWTILRETGYADTFYPQKGNYDFWLEQDDSIPQGRTVPTTYLPKSGIVLGSHYAAYGDACVNPAVETSQAFLGGLSGDAREGWICRRTDQGTSNRYMGFKVDGRYREAHATSRDATISVAYLDRGTDSWQLQYDSFTSGPYKVAEGRTVQKTDTGAWRTATFHMPDARFLRGQLGGADLRIDCLSDGNEYIHLVDIRFGTGSAEALSLAPGTGSSTSDGVLTLANPPQATQTMLITYTTVASISHPVGNLQVAGSVFQLRASTPSGQPVITPTTPLTLTMHYEPAFLPPGISEGNLQVYRYDVASSSWMSLVVLQRDLIEHSVTVLLDHLSEFALLAASGTSTTLNLSPGWNLLSLPLAPENTAITQALSSIAGRYDLVYAYDAFSAPSWKKYNVSAPAFLNTLTRTSETQGLWIRASDAVSLTITGTLPTNPAIALRAGWNLVGYPSQTTRPVTEALASIDGKYDLVYAYDAANVARPWSKYNVSAPAFLNTLKEMGPGWGYWIRAKEDCVWQMP